ncbi:hypothetical protein LTR84_001816 [Exophiala bonariae]|uniref:Cytochrome P450 n=1 Tax=Exophiala bonariae TaxID=1690606 RepID=A0AAV9NFF0_9EURO|nr:hypothetical protein LTR84_001816 [Exophiala bonariae]
MNSIHATLFDFIHSGHLALLSLSIIAIVWFGRYIYGIARDPLKKVPGPFINRCVNWKLKFATISGRRMYYVHELHERYGPYVRLSPTEVTVSDPEGFIQIHKVSSGFTKANWYNELVNLERSTLFTMVDAKDHGARRRLMARAFSKTYLRQHWEGVVREKVRLCITKLLEESNGVGKANILKWWTLMTTDVATHLMFGESFHMIEQGKKDEYIRILEIALMGGGIGAELPLVRAIGKHLPFEPFKTLFGGNKYIMEKAQTAVNNAYAADGEKNLFAHIIHEAGKGEQLDEIDVKLEAGALIVAGSDTTAVTLTYLVWCVLSSPELSASLCAELKGLPVDYSDRDLEDLPVLSAVIEETLRLYGAAPGGIPRQKPNGPEYLGGYLIPAGTTVTTQAYSLHRNARIFPDPLAFDHTRWLPTEGFTRENLPEPELAKSIFSPFGAGARACLGIHLARTELRLGAAEFFLRCPNAKLAPTTTPQSMEMENHFLIAPKSHKCEIIC